MDKKDQENTKTDRHWLRILSSEDTLPELPFEEFASDPLAEMLADIDEEEIQTSLDSVKVWMNSIEGEALTPGQPQYLEQQFKLIKECDQRIKYYLEELSLYLN